MASPSLKITLKLSGPKPVDSGSPASSTASSVKNVNLRDEDVSSSEGPRKKVKSNNGRSRKPKLEGTPAPDTPVALDDDKGDETPISNRRGGGGGAGSSGQPNANTVSLKELLKHKNVKVRKWKSKPLVFYSSSGKEIEIPSWQSDEKMTLNDQPTEPITVAEIDQMFSSTAGEKDFRPFFCTQPGCSKSFTSLDQLQTHETNMHGTKKLVCGIDGCHKSFVTPGQLTKHRKMVHFRAARKAKMAAAAAAAAAEEDAGTPSALNETDSVDIANA